MKVQNPQDIDSETAIVDGDLYSDRDFEEEFIDIHGMHFLYIRTQDLKSGGIVEDSIYTISSDEKTLTILFQDVRKIHNTERERRTAQRWLSLC